LCAGTFTGGRGEDEHYLAYVSKRLILCPVIKGSDAKAAELHRTRLKNSAERLKRDHGEHFLVWNMTRPEKALFSSRDFDEQVLNVSKFPLYVPTLNFTFEFCNMIRFWHKQDPLNVAVILYEDCKEQPHVDPLRMTINDESRIAYLVSAYLAYSGEAKTAFDALDLITEVRGDECETAVPSQTLYYRYIDDIRQSGFTNTEAINLDCIFVHTIPILPHGAKCRPILEITCNGREVRLNEQYTSIKHPKFTQFEPNDEIMVFESLGASVWGDVVISCYHVNMGFVAKEANRIDGRTAGAAGKHSAEHIPIFRICFHVGFLQPGGQMQRLKKQDLDFACDAPFPAQAQEAPAGLALSPDFSVDLIFQKCNDGGASDGNELEEFIFPSDFAGLTNMNEMHVVKPSNEYKFLISEYLNLQRRQDPKRADVNEKVRE
jgi:hypothetical protein